MVVVLLFVALASIITLNTPSWEAADEPGHVQNIETLVSGHWYRIDPACLAKAPANGGIAAYLRFHAAIVKSCADEVQQPPLYYLLMAGWQHLVGIPAQPPAMHLDSGLGIGHTELFQNHPGRSYLLWLRFPNILLGAATVVLTFLAARLATRDQWTPVIAAALVAFLPHFVFLSAFVTNDNLVNLLGAVLTLCALRFTKHPTTGRMVATGAVFGLLVTTKLSALPVGLVLLVLACMVPTWTRRLWLLAGGTITALAVSSWYLIQNWARYGDPLARHASALYLARIGALGTGWGALFGAPYVVNDPLHLVFIDVPKRLMTEFWYQSGWLQFVWSTDIGIFITCVVVVVLFGIYGQRIDRSILVTLGAISLLALSSVWLIAFQTATYSARYSFVGLTAMATLIALALQRWPLAMRWALPVAGFVGCMIAIHNDVFGVHWT